MMTAIKRRLAWMEARNKLKLSQSSDDWPDHLGLGVIGGLYNPDDWGILGGALRAAADAGELEVNRKTQTVARKVRRGGPIIFVFSGAPPVDSSRMVRVETVETTQEIITASATSVARYLEGSGIGFPPLLLAWLSPHLAQGAESEAFGEQIEPPKLTAMKRAAIINQLSRRYPSLESDFNRPEEWVKGCSTGKRGMYYLEKIEDGCHSKWAEGDIPPAPVASIQTNKIRG